MIHARTDYDRIQDPQGHIPDDEAVFLLRAQDWSAPFVVRIWAGLNEAASPEIARRAREHADLMEQQQAERGCKIPDMPEYA